MLGRLGLSAGSQFAASHASSRTAPRALCLWICVALASLCGEPFGAASASDWPRFRGPNGQGISADKNVPVKVDAAQPAWKLKAGGGNSSPMIYDGKVYVQASGEEGNSRSIICASLKDGTLIWEETTAGKTSRIHKLNSLASGTPATDGKHVFVPFWDGSHLFLSAYSLDGKPAWKKDLGEFNSQHGAGHSPIVFEDKVILSNDQDDAASLVALNAATGEVVWETPRPPSRANYLTPIIVEEAGRPPELIVASTPGFGGYDPRTGKELWHWNWTGNGLRTVGSLAYGQGLVITGSGNGAGARNAVAIRVGGSGDVSDSAKAWEEKSTFPYVPTMLTWEDHLYFVNDRGVSGCHVLKTGENVWIQRLGGNFFASPILVNGKIYAINDSGELFVFDAALKYSLVAKSSINEPVLASPAVANDTLVIRTRDHVYGFSGK